MENMESLGNQPLILGRFMDSLGLYVSHDMPWKTPLHLLPKRGRRAPARTGFESYSAHSIGDCPFGTALFSSNSSLQFKNFSLLT